jgi:hypothetical protein
MSRIPLLVEEAMDELPENTPNLVTELRTLHQAIAQLGIIMTAKAEAPPPAVMRLKAAAAYLAMTLIGLRSAVKTGGIPCRRQGKLYIFLKADLDRWLAALPGITVEAALKTIKPEHSVVYVQQSVTLRHAEPALQEPMLLKRGPKGTNRLRLQNKARKEAPS